jgi:hypothetical protein
MKIHLKIEPTGKLVLKLEPLLDMKKLPRVTISNVTKHTAFNIHFLTGTYAGLIFFNLHLEEGEKETTLIWDKKEHFVHLFPFAGGIDIFNHSLSPIEFDLFVEGVTCIPVDSIQELALEKEVVKSMLRRKKGNRTSGIKFVD